MVILFVRIETKRKQLGWWTENEILEDFEIQEDELIHKRRADFGMQRKTITSFGGIDFIPADNKV